MNKMNNPILKSVHTEASINIEYPSTMNSYGYNTYSLSHPSQNQSTIISGPKTGCSVSSKKPDVTFSVTNNIKFENEDSKDSMLASSSTKYHPHSLTPLVSNVGCPVSSKQPAAKIYVNEKL